MDLLSSNNIITYSVSSHGPLRLASLSLNRALIEATAASIIFSYNTHTALNKYS